MRPRARLAAPLVLTVAVLPGCGSRSAEDGSCRPPDCVMNPPPPPPPPPPTATAQQAESTFATPPPKAPTAAVAQDLPQASPGARVSQRPDGTCWESHEVRCPPNVSCNPPPPRQVACPQR